MCDLFGDGCDRLGIFGYVAGEFVAERWEESAEVPPLSWRLSILV
jgi:hypothetical protein